MKIAKVQSTGKPGAEEAALAAAKKVGIAASGWRPKGSDCEYNGVQEAPSKKEEQSIIWNVRDAHATLIIGPLEGSSSASLAYEVAQSYGRPVLISQSKTEIVRWLNTMGEEITLNIVGPSEAEVKGISRKVKSLLSNVFAVYDSIFIN